MRALLYEAAWCYRQPAKAGQWIRRDFPADVPQYALDIGLEVIDAFVRAL
jgi:hypothetical protein